MHASNQYVHRDCTDVFVCLITYTIYFYIYIFIFTVQEMTEDDWEAAEQLMKCEQDCLAEWGF